MHDITGFLFGYLTALYWKKLVHPVKPLYFTLFGSNSY
ncbi:hypothetical protein bpmyx0001_50410 [Bacillus pseudomycoides DSM 12442]|nr:hypothetical protein bpmyx0001_50410 [Bacillus pseudomycoides DSM 12442]